MTTQNGLDLPHPLSPNHAVDEAADDLVFTASGLVTAAGLGEATHWQRLSTGNVVADSNLLGFNPAPHLPDRRVLKAVSRADAIGLAALGLLLRERNYKPGLYESERIGLYVGAMASSAFDNEPYMDAMQAAKGTDGQVDIVKFGQTSCHSRPTTLLMGLPNNVLSYGAVMLDSRGPNSNYISLFHAGLHALANGARRLRRGTVDMVVAGSFGMHSEPVGIRILQKLGVTSADDQAPTRATDAAAFVCLERRATAVERGATPGLRFLGSCFSSDGLGPMRFDQEGRAMAWALTNALTQCGLQPDDIGLVLATQCGLPALDAVERRILADVFGGAAPAIAALAPILGNTLESGGLVDLLMAPAFFTAGVIPTPLQVEGSAMAIPEHRRHVLVLRTSPWGEYGCVIGRLPPPAARQTLAQ